MLKLTDGIITRWLDTGTVESIRAVGAQIGNSDQLNKSNVATRQGASSVMDTVGYDKSVINIPKNIVTNNGNDAQRGSPKASSIYSDTPIDLSMQNAAVQVINAIVKKTSVPVASRDFSEKAPRELGSSIECFSQAGNKNHEGGSTDPDYQKNISARTAYNRYWGSESDSNSEGEPHAKHYKSK